MLRRYSLDELPQLINVVRGEMSLVGPRPLILEENAHVTDWAERRLDLKPGMTGLWQVLGRDEIPFEEMVKLDYLYVTSWSVARRHTASSCGRSHRISDQVMAAKALDAYLKGRPYMPSSRIRATAGSCYPSGDSAKDADLGNRPHPSNCAKTRNRPSRDRLRFSFTSEVVKASSQTG